ncbi:MAG: hypothetical protein M3Y82_15380 [Verrucomicrobiota bacterium]|nr:hypothetical protein [Verrucomicrobiota bacterium]
MKEIRFHHSVLKEIRSRTSKERREIGEKIAEAQNTMGQPHLHKGIGIRKLRNDYFEIRVGLKDRLVFAHTRNALVFELIGHHNEVQRFLKDR